MKEKIYEVKVNGCSIFFEGLEQLEMPQSTHDAYRPNVDGPLEWTSNMLQQAAKPLVDALEVLHETSKSLESDELELSMKLGFALKGNTPVFNVISVDGNCQFTARFVWKNK